MSKKIEIFEFRGDKCPRCGEQILTDITTLRKVCDYEWGCGYDSDIEAKQLSLF